MNFKCEIQVPKEKLAAFCKEQHIVSLALFGSALNGDFQDDSDIDLLVQFEEGKKPDLFKLLEMERALSELFRGRKIDLRTPEDLSKYFRNEVVNKAEVLYS